MTTLRASIIFAACNIAGFLVVVLDPGPLLFLVCFLFVCFVGCLLFN